jgi:hypothetical protein
MSSCRVSLLRLYSKPPSVTVGVPSVPSRTIFGTKSICHPHHVPYAWLQMLAGYKTPSRSASASFILHHTVLRLFTKMVLRSVHGCSQNQDCANLWRVWTTIREAFDEWYMAAGPVQALVNKSGGVSFYVTSGSIFGTKKCLSPSPCCARGLPLRHPHELDVARALKV